MRARARACVRACVCSFVRSFVIVAHKMKRRDDTFRCGAFVRPRDDDDDDDPATTRRLSRERVINPRPSIHPCAPTRVARVDSSLEHPSTSPARSRPPARRPRARRKDESARMFRHSFFAVVSGSSVFSARAKRRRRAGRFSIQSETRARVIPTETARDGRGGGVNARAGRFRAASSARRRRETRRREMLRETGEAASGRSRAASVGRS